MNYARWLKDLSRVDFLTSVGLYVAPEALYLVRLRKSLRHLSVLEAESREIPRGADAAARAEALREALRSFLPYFNPAKEPIHICLSPDQVMSLELSLPQAAEENLAQVVEYEIDRHLPLRREDLYYDFLPLGKTEDKVGLLLFAAPKKAVDEILEICSALGAKTGGVETSATALSNFLLFCAPDLTGPSVLLGGRNRDWEIIGLQPGGNGWKQEAALTFSHWLPQSEWIQGSGREIFYSALSSSPKCFGWGNAAEFLKALNEDALQLEDLRELAKSKLRADGAAEHPMCLPAMGAALSGLREATLNLNLLPGAKERGRSKALTWLHASLTALLLAALLGWTGIYFVKDEIRLRQLQKENEKVAPSVEALRREETALTGLRKQVDFLTGLKNQRGVVLRALDELSRLVPIGAYVSNLRFRDGTVELQGSAENASNLVPLLERSPMFENVTSTAPSSQARDNRQTFSLKAEIERLKKSPGKP
jgi:Tfp pilus assembly protein PilN